MNLSYLKDAGIEDLKAKFTKHIRYYQSGDQAYFQKFFDEHKYLSETNLQIPESIPLLISDDRKKDTVHNAKMIHMTLSNLSPYLAISENVWAALTHTIFFEYIVRKNEDAFSTENKRYEKNIENAFFTYTQGKRRGTFINGIASLWWGAYMVYDKDNLRDPYELVNDIAMTGYPSTILLLSSSRIMGRKDTALGFFKVVHALREAGETLNRQAIVEGVKYLNLLAGVSLLDLKTQGEISELTRNFYKNYLKV